MQCIYRYIHTHTHTNTHTYICTHIHTMEYYPVIKNEIIPLATTLINPELITLIKMSEKMNTM